MKLENLLFDAREERDDSKLPVFVMLRLTGIHDEDPSLLEGDRTPSGFSDLWRSELVWRMHVMPATERWPQRGDLGQAQDQAHHLPSAHRIDSKSYLPLRNCALTRRRAA